MTAQHRFLPNLTPEVIAAVQTEGLNWTLRHAYAGNPRYRERLAAAGETTPEQRLRLVLEVCCRLYFTGSEVNAAFDQIKNGTARVLENGTSD